MCTPDLVSLHDPFWGPHGVTDLAHRLGATVIAVHLATPALGTAAIPGPDGLYVPLSRRVYRRAYKTVDAVMSVVDPLPDPGARLPHETQPTSPATELLTRGEGAEERVNVASFGLPPTAAA